ncbi:hypothetical protein ACT3T9_00765 [Brachybacterium sp. AOP29-B2-41]
MEFLFIIVIGVIFVVQFAMKQRGKDDSSGSSLWGGGDDARTSSRPRMRPRPQAPQPKSLDEALRLSQDRQAPPTIRYAGLEYDDDDTLAAPTDGSASAPDDVPVMTEMSRTEPNASHEPDSAPDRGTDAEVETGRSETGRAGIEPDGVGPAGIEPAEAESFAAESFGVEPFSAEPLSAEPVGSDVAEPRRAAEPFTPAYSASVYTPTSVYTGYTPTSLYTSGTSILGGAKQVDPQREEPETDPDEDAQEPGPEEGQRS